MAVFLLKGKHGQGFVPPACSPPGIFADVTCPATAQAPFVDWIEQLFHEGITGGCSPSGPPLYCPNNPVTRAQMAVLLLKAEHGPSFTPPACTGVFTDVQCSPPPDFAVDFIEQLFHEGITGGCNISGTQYCPNKPNTRGQMAVFLVRTFGLLLYGP